MYTPTVLRFTVLENLEMFKDWNDYKCCKIGESFTKLISAVFEFYFQKKKKANMYGKGRFPTGSLFLN